MRASPRIIVLGESGDLCIADNGPSEEHKTVIFSGRWLHFSLTVVADGRVLEDCGGAGHGHLPTAAGDGFPCSPAISEKVAQPLVK